MRISDWSSDVCSSDLGAPCAGDHVRIEQRHLEEDSGGLVAAAGQFSAHDAADALRAGVVVDRHHLAVEAVGVAVEGKDLGAGLGQAHDQVALHLAGIEDVQRPAEVRSEEHTSELQSLLRISYAVFCLTK